MTSQTLGRRIAAPVQSTELDLSYLPPRDSPVAKLSGYLVQQEETVRKRVAISF
jgi:hypothetical protein